MHELTWLGDAKARKAATHVPYRLLQPIEQVGDPASPARSLTGDQRQQLVKMGDKSEAFCRQAGHVFAENPGILPGSFDLPGYQRDMATLDALRPRLLRLGKLYQRAQDTDMAVGSDLMTNALQGYAFLKVAGKGQGLDEMRKMLSARFARSHTSAGELAPAAEPATA
jgi:hypothetical protein